MLAEERFQTILDYLSKKNTATISELAAQLKTSESTVRRDIASLHQVGRLKKIHGGAMALKAGLLYTAEEDVATRQGMNVAEKDLIARYAAGMVHRGDFVYMDAGTTTYQMLDYIEAPGAIFVTNGIAHAKALLKKGLRTYLLGGEIRLKTDALVGADCLKALQKYNFTKCFMGVNGIDAARGFTTPDTEEGTVKAEAVRQSYVTFVLADHTKFNRVYARTYAPLHAACIITDHLPDKKYQHMTVIKEVGNL